MAALLPNENEIREGIKSGKYPIDPLVLNALDVILSDYLVSIELTVKNYIEENTPMDIGHAEVLLEYSRSINKVFLKVMIPDTIGLKDNDLLQQIKRKEKETQMHKEIRGWLSHHVGNDAQGINFIIGDFIDDKIPLPVKYLSDRVMPRAEAMRDILSALLAAPRKDGFS